nr:ester cyclase [Ktedonobacteraceae bacterium]
MQEEENTTTIPQMVEEVRAGRMLRRNFMKTLAALGLSAAGASTISAATALPTPIAKTTPAAHPDEQPAQNLQLHQQHLAHQTSGDSGAIQNDYAEHAVVEDSMHPEPFVGKAAIMSRKGVGMAAIPDLQIQVHNRVAHGAQVAVEWTAAGTHTGDFPGLAASGRSFSIRGVTVVVREEGKIVREAIYYDMHEVRRQLS